MVMFIGTFCDEAFVVHCIALQSYCMNVMVLMQRTESKGMQTNTIHAHELFSCAIFFLYEVDLTYFFVLIIRKFCANEYNTSRMT